MVSVPTMLSTLSLALSAASASSLTSLPTFDLPTFDYPTLTAGDAPQRLLQAITTDGIVALRNVPNYANLRERYLREAALCAAVTGDADHDTFVSRKLFEDGTKRMTISTNAGRELRGSAVETDAKCPGFRQLYEEFSQTIEHAVQTFGAALDQTSFTASDGHKTISSRRLMADAVRLDHFHAYEAATAEDVPSNNANHRELAFSLPLHEDHGLFIAMSAPKYFEVEADGRRLVERELKADASGLIIQTASGERVRPVLNGDEVVLMMGTGASRWLQTSHAVPAVLHGMQMPEPMVASSMAGRRSLRAWFGKMTLLPSYQRMLQSDAVFEEHVNATTRQLLGRETAQLMTVGCATGRYLAPSDEKCTVRQCSLKDGATPPSEPCAVICNRKGHSPNDAPDCAAKCTCTDIPGPANICWMLCVANLPTSSCALDDQVCSGQSIVCAGTPPPPVTPPVTPSPPVTSSLAPPPPATPPPSDPTPAPTTPSPATPPPSGSTPAPTTPAPTSGTPSQSTPARTSGDHC